MSAVVAPATTKYRQTVEWFSVLGGYFNQSQTGASTASGEGGIVELNLRVGLGNGSDDDEAYRRALFVSHDSEHCLKP